jgi:hypothetical protein
MTWRGDGLVGLGWSAMSRGTQPATFQSVKLCFERRISLFRMVLLQGTVSPIETAMAA